MKGNSIISRILTKFITGGIAAAFVIFAPFVSGRMGNAFGQGGNTVSGMVFGVNRRPMSELQVELLDEFGRTIQRTRTYSGGRYFFNTGVPAGRLIIRVRTFETEYEEQEQPIEIQNFTHSDADGGSRTSGFENVQKDFYLKLRKGALPPAESVFVQAVPAQAKELYGKALSDLENKKQKEAFEKLKSALEIFPRYFDALEKLGTEYALLNYFEAYQAADILLTIAVDVNPRAFRSWRGLAYSRYALKKFPEALAAAEKAIELNSYSAELVFLSGRLLRQNSRFEDAEKRLLKARDLSKDSIPKVHWELARLYADDMKRFADAAKELKLFLKAEPNAKDAENIKKLIVEFEAKGNKKS